MAMADSETHLEWLNHMIKEAVVNQFEGGTLSIPGFARPAP